MHPHRRGHMHTPHMNTYGNISPPLHWQMAQPEAKRARRGQALVYTHTHTHTQMPNPPCGAMMMQRALKGPFGKHLFSHPHCLTNNSIYCYTESRGRHWKCRGREGGRGGSTVWGEKLGKRVKRRDKVKEERVWGDKLGAGRLRAGGGRGEVQSSICLNVARDEASDRERWFT